MSKAAAASGSDGIMIEVHYNPKVALSDGQQTLFPAQFKQLVSNLKPFVKAAGKNCNAIH